jgi:phosphotransferase system  glucose/maltose/N-acetylglucosamine-specific IIC component
MKNITPIRVYVLFAGLLAIWVLISPVENHSVYHWEIIVGLFLSIIIFLTVEYFLKKNFTNTSTIDLIELIILLFFFLLWHFLTSF